MSVSVLVKRDQVPAEEHKRGDPPQQPSQVVACGTQHGMVRIAVRTLQRTAAHAAVVFDVGAR